MSPDSNYLCILLIFAYYISWHQFSSHKLNESQLSMTMVVTFYTGINPRTQEGVQNARGALYMMSSEISFTVAYSVIYELPGQLLIFQRENSVYDTGPYYCATFLGLVIKVLRHSATELMSQILIFKINKHNLLNCFIAFFISTAIFKSPYLQDKNIQTKVSRNSYQCTLSMGSFFQIPKATLKALIFTAVLYLILITQVDFVNFLFYCLATSTAAICGTAYGLVFSSWMDDVDVITSIMVPIDMMFLLTAGMFYNLR